MDSPASVKTSNLYSPSTVDRSSSADSQSRPFAYKIVSIEGNIGSGKTTLLANIRKTLGENKNIVFLKEPVDTWDTIRDAQGQTMLQKFYADQEKYSFPFQMMAYITRLTLLRTAIRQNPDAIIITERSLYVRPAAVRATVRFAAHPCSPCTHRPTKWFSRECFTTTARSRT